MCVELHKMTPLSVGLHSTFVPLAYFCSKKVRQTLAPSSGPPSGLPTVRGSHGILIWMPGPRRSAPASLAPRRRRPEGVTRLFCPGENRRAVPQHYGQLTVRPPRRLPMHPHPYLLTPKPPARLLPPSPSKGLAWDGPALLPWGDSDLSMGPRGGLAGRQQGA